MDRGHGSREGEEHRPWHFSHANSFAQLLIVRYLRPACLSAQISAGTAITLLVAICSLASSLRASSPQAASKFSRPMLAQGIAATLLAIALAQTLWRSEQVPFTALDGNLRILNSTASTTGRIVVADNLVDGYRFLRCDHSLLGGRWMRQSASDGEGVELGDSSVSPLRQRLGPSPGG